MFVSPLPDPLTNGVFDIKRTPPTESTDRASIWVCLSFGGSVALMAASPLVEDANGGIGGALFAIGLVWHAALTYVQIDHVILKRIDARASCANVFSMGTLIAAIAFACAKGAGVNPSLSVIFMRVWFCIGICSSLLIGAFALGRANDERPFIYVIVAWMLLIRGILMVLLASVVLSASVVYAPCCFSSAEFVVLLLYMLIVWGHYIFKA